MWSIDADRRSGHLAVLLTALPHSWQRHPSRSAISLNEYASLGASNFLARRARLDRRPVSGFCRAHLAK